MTQHKIPKIAERIERFKGRILTLVEETLSWPNGTQSVHAIVRHPGAVVVLPQAADGSLLILRQYRHAIGREILEFPAGTLNIGEDPLACTKRELIEETDFAASQWTPLGVSLPAPGFCDEVQHFFLAQGLTPQVGQPDDDEVISVEQISVAEFERLLSSGELIDGKSMAIYARALLSGILPPGSADLQVRS